MNISLYNLVIFLLYFSPSHRHGHSLGRHNIVYDSLTPAPILAMPPPTSPAPRAPNTFSNALKSTLRSSSASISDPISRIRSLTPDHDPEEGIALNPKLPSASHKLVPLAIEPTNDQSAAIATVLIQMPKCTSEPRSNRKSNNLGVSLVNLNDDETSTSTIDRARKGSPARTEKFKDCDIVPVTVGGGNSQTLSFGCVLVNTGQGNKSKYHVTKNILISSNRNNQ